MASRGQVEIPSELLAQAVAAGASAGLPRQTPILTPIETPLTFSGFNDNVLREFGPLPPDRPARATRSTPEPPCRECGTGAGLHVVDCSLARGAAT